MEQTERTINIEKAIKDSDNKLLKSLPQFVINILRKIICEDELNSSFELHRHLEGIAFVNDVLKEWNTKITVRAEENIPVNGRFIFVANHPMGGIDALSFLSVISRHFSDVISPSNQLFNYIPNLRCLIIGLDVFGHATKETARQLDELYASDTQVMIFPAGEVSRKIKGRITDIPWQKSFVTKAIQHKRDIIPVHISGRNSNLFYNIANIRKLLGIKMYIETILLPREMMQQKNIEVILTIGKVIPWQWLTPEKTHYEWAQKIRDIVYSLPSSAG